MEPITGDELLFFDRMPAMLPVYEALRTQLLARCPGTSIKVSRSQISFRSKYIYAMASLPVRRRKDWPEVCLVVSFGLADRLESPRIAVAVEPYPRRWTHHVMSGTVKELDQELLGLQKKTILFTAECQMITPMLATRGKIELTQRMLLFTVNPDFEREFNEQIEKQAAYLNSNKRIEGINKFTMLKLPENKIWRLTELTHEEFRLYLFRNTAVELFFQDSTSAFFSFPNAGVRDHFHAALRQLPTPNLTEFLGATPAERCMKDDCTRRWLNREISTFEYLMRLNRLAGRTYNDLSQYYVFPWVIADYSSPTIDLRNPKIYRDFSYPMGAQLESRRDCRHSGDA